MEEDRQVTEVRTTDNQIDNTNVRRQVVARRADAPGVVVAQRVVYYIGGVIIAILALRFILQLLGANQGNGFVDFVYGLSSIFVAPFYGIFGEPTFGQSQFETSTLVAIIIYALLMVGIAKPIALASPRDEI